MLFSITLYCTFTFKSCDFYDGGCLWQFNPETAQQINNIVTILFYFLGETDDREQAKLEVKVWDPDSQLTDHQIDQFLVVAR